MLLAKHMIKYKQILAIEVCEWMLLSKDSSSNPYLEIKETLAVNRMFRELNDSP